MSTDENRQAISGSFGGKAVTSAVPSNLFSVPHTRSLSWASGNFSLRSDEKTSRSSSRVSCRSAVSLFPAQRSGCGVVSVGSTRMRTGFRGRPASGIRQLKHVTLGILGLQT